MGLTTDYVKQKHLGVIQDIAPEDVPAEFWTSAVNVTFPDGASLRREGYSPYSDPLPTGEQPYYAGAVTGLNLTDYWLWFTADQVWVTDGQTHTDITPVGGLNPTNPGSWSFTNLGGLPVFNNPQNPPMYWDLNTANPSQVLPGWPVGATCAAMRAVKYHLVALNITETGISYPSQVWWSEGAQAGAIPQEWIPTAENDAGDTVLGDSPGVIVDGFPLRDQLIIYKGSSTYTMQYVAGQYVYAFRKLFPTVGLQSLNCVCEIEGQQVAFTGEDVIAHDGQNFQSIVDRKVQRTLVDSIDKTQIQLCNVVARVVDRQVWICIPVSGGDYLTVAYVVNVDDGLIGLIELPDVAAVARGTINPAGVEAQQAWEDDDGQWDLDATIWTQSSFSPTGDSIMMIQPGPVGGTGILLANGLGQSANGQPVTASLERLSMRIGEGVYHSVITQIAPQFEGENGIPVKIRLGYQNFFNDPITWLPARDFTIGQSRAVSQIIDGRYLSIRFDITTENIWSLSGYYLKLKEGGEY
jgi:hypothetical protein